MSISQQNEKTIIQKLDLDRYIEQFEKFFARLKPIAMHGDVNQHYRHIKALSTIQYPPPKEVPNLDMELARIKKQAILGIDEIFVFVKIVTYFNSLKAIELPEPTKSWIDQIEIPQEIMEILGYFTQDGKINPQIDQELFDIQRAIKNNKRSIKESLYKIVRSSPLQEYLVDSQIHYQNGEETLLVRGGFTHAIKATIVGRSSGGYFYIIPKKISELKDRESHLLSQEEEVVYRYCQKISAILYKWERFLNYINREYDRFDHYQARVSFARAYEYEFILPNKSRRVELVDFSHPAIDDPVPVTIDLNHSVMLITGVNAGGKTMLLKSILSAVYMSKYLLPFKCDASRTKVGHYKHIEAVIDDPQSVKNDISTFAGRMVEFAKLFKSRDVIVGVDEIELGTDSDEAATLFRVMLDELRKRDITFVVTTHHKRLASLMGADDSVELIAALYDETRRVPTYTFLQGSIGKSYAFETAHRYGIPANLVAKAKVIYGEDKENLNELIERSTALEREMRQKISAIDSEREKLERKRSHLEEIEDQLKEEHRRAIATLENRYNAATKRAREALKAKESTEGRRLLNKAHQFKELNRDKPIQPKEKIALKEGDYVKYRKHKGDLISLRGDKATIEIDGMKMRVSASELKRIEDNRKVTQATKRRANVSVEKGSASVSIKLLGMYGDEAIDSVDKFLSDALVNGINEVQIIHGTGGGILSKLVSEFLSSHPKIKKFYKMPGNFGVTIVEL